VSAIFDIDQSEIRPILVVGGGGVVLALLRQKNLVISEH
jgi:hypothetical protein